MQMSRPAAAMSPPSVPLKPWVCSPCFLARSKAASTLALLPLVEKPTAMFPGSPKAITWREKTFS